jgi:molybdate transport system substrate-binding protein
MQWLRYGVLAALSLAGSLNTASAGTVTVAAASNLVLAMESIATQFNARTGHTVKLSFGSSGNFARQIVRGAPFELFFSANRNYVDLLVKRGKTLDAGKSFAVGYLALFVPGERNIALLGDLSDLGPAVADGRLHRLAIANPEHAPYGQAAREALQNAGIWPVVKPRLVLAENAAQAVQFATSGAVDAALIPLSLTPSPELRAKGSFVTVDESLYKPLPQYIVQLKNTSGPSLEFANFMREEGVRAILAEYGFGTP